MPTMLELTRPDATATYGLAATDIRIGDVAMFLRAGSSAPRAGAGLEAAADQGTLYHQTSLAPILIGSASAPRTHGRNTRACIAALAGSDPKGAHALVTDLLRCRHHGGGGGPLGREIDDAFWSSGAGAQTHAAAGDPRR